MLWFVVLLADGRIKSVSVIKTAEPQKKLNAKNVMCYKVSTRWGGARRNGNKNQIAHNRIYSYMQQGAYRITCGWGPNEMDFRLTISEIVTEYKKMETNKKKASA